MTPLTTARAASQGVPTHPRQAASVAARKLGAPYVHVGQERYAAIDAVAAHAGMDTARALYGDPRSIRHWPALSASAHAVIALAHAATRPDDLTLPSSYCFDCFQTHARDAARQPDPRDAPGQLLVAAAALALRAEPLLGSAHMTGPFGVPDPADASWIFEHAPTAVAAYLFASTGAAPDLGALRRLCGAALTHPHEVADEALTTLHRLDAPLTDRNLRPTARAQHAH